PRPRLLPPVRPRRPLGRRPALAGAHGTCGRAHLLRRGGRASRRRRPAHQSGRTTEGAGTFRDAVRSTVKKVARARGLNVVVICLRVDPPRGGTPIALPLNLRIRARKSGKKTTGPAAEMTREIAVWLPGRRLHLTGDGACACLAGAGLPRTHVTSRIRRDAALYAPAPPRTGRRGRPRTRCARLGRPPELAATAPATAWHKTTWGSPFNRSSPGHRPSTAARLAAAPGSAGAPGPLAGSAGSSAAACRRRCCGSAPDRGLRRAPAAGRRRARGLASGGSWSGTRTRPGSSAGAPPRPGPG